MTKKASNNPNHKNELTRERILVEAEALFANNGYHAVSVRAVSYTHLTLPTILLV